MKTVVLAGGLGTRLQEETDIRPKPMVEIGGEPILWHILKHYAHHGSNEFLIALGYRGEVIKRYFLDYYTLSGSMTIDLLDGNVSTQRRDCENWIVHLLETGLSTNTGGRLWSIKQQVGNERFMLTYGDGVANVDLQALLQFHESHGRMATLTAVRPPARFGGLVFEGDLIKRFTEKPQTGEGWINGGFMVFEPDVFDLLTGRSCSLEADLLDQLAKVGQLAAFRHDGFWQCMDTLRDKTLLENLWQQGSAPWKTWPATDSGLTGRSSLPARQGLLEVG